MEYKLLRMNGQYFFRRLMIDIIFLLCHMINIILSFFVKKDPIHVYSAICCLLCSLTRHRIVWKHGLVNYQSWGSHIIFIQTSKTIWRRNQIINYWRRSPQIGLVSNLYVGTELLIIGAGVPRSLSGLVSNLCVGTELSIIGAGVPRSSSRHVRILNVGTELSIIGAGVPRSLSWQNLSCLVKKDHIYSAVFRCTQ